MMKQFTGAAMSIILILVLSITYSCAPNISLSVAVPENLFDNRPGQTKLYLLDADDYAGIQDIITKNQEYYRSKLLAISDSVRALKRKFNTLQKELESVAENCSTLALQLPLDYCEKISAEPAKIAKYGDIWQLTVELTNNGNEDVWGLVLSVLFKDIYLINQHKYTVHLQPGDDYFLNNINFDLSSNLPLQYSIVSYPGGIDQALNEAITVHVDSVILPFPKSLSDCRSRQENLTAQIENIGITLDMYSDQAVNYLDQAVIVPVNNIIKEKLRLVEHHSSLAVADTVTFNGLKKGIYQLLVYSDAASDSTQYIIPVDLTKIKEFTIDISKYEPALFFMSKQQFINNISRFIGQ